MPRLRKQFDFTLHGKGGILHQQALTGRQIMLAHHQLLMAEREGTGIDCTLRSVEPILVD